jgi:branched-chain amino acid aminotransferase
VYGADEAFVTGTFGGLTPVTKIDGKPLNNPAPGTMTQRLTSLYDQLIESEIHQK